MNQNEANIADMASSVLQRAQRIGNPLDANCRIAICYKLLWQHECGKILI